MYLVTTDRYAPDKDFIIRGKVQLQTFKTK